MNLIRDTGMFSIVEISVDESPEQNSVRISHESITRLGFAGVRSGFDTTKMFFNEQSS